MNCQLRLDILPLQHMQPLHTRVDKAEYCVVYNRVIYLKVTFPIDLTDNCTTKSVHVEQIYYLYSIEMQKLKL